MNLRDLPVYKMHLDANEPEEHTRISVQAAISVLEELSHQIGSGLGREFAYKVINHKIIQLRQSLLK